MQAEGDRQTHAVRAHVVRATVAYDGTDFFGFQLQAQGRTVQGALEAALCRITQAETRVIGSGRTDAGVHATGQVVGFRTPWQHSLPELQRALNAVLPADVAVLDIAAAAEEWHARFSAVRRDYVYTVLNRPIRSPLERRYSHLVTQPLRLDALQAAADVVAGEHDFAAFGRPMQPGETTVRRIFAARWAQDGPTFTLTMSGNAFLRGMVRSLVGCMLQAGLGQWPAETMAAVLAGRDRAAAAPPVPACGLCLVKVHYDPDEGLLAQYE
jgi:tRNA pseudouridine38-40 synthase